MPELPTMIESGVPDYVVADLHRRGGAALARRPRIVGKLNAAINKALQAPEVAAAAARLNADVRPASAEEFGAFLAKERDKWQEVVRLSGVRIE